ncbi:ATP-binding protein [Pseudonocardia sp. S2-4]|uniref:ATP-binding protein n=1 Tax=Pseudonocardia humida TaxID=2800819 RepID=A0ABT1ABU6_9PSEU|nr:ATP-binding protein [Pseudonocardia humida]
MRTLRSWLRERLDDERLVDVELVCVELVTNAIEHARAPRAVRIRLAPRGRARIEVDDAGPPRALAPRLPTLHELRGRGLALVDALSTWGVRLTPTGKTVWASL